MADTPRYSVSRKGMGGRPLGVKDYEPRCLALHGSSFSACGRTVLVIDGLYTVSCGADACNVFLSKYPDFGEDYKVVLLDGYKSKMEKREWLSRTQQQSLKTTAKADYKAKRDELDLQEVQKVGKIRKIVADASSTKTHKASEILDSVKAVEEKVAAAWENVKEKVDDAGWWVCGIMCISIGGSMGGYYFLILL